MQAQAEFAMNRNFFHTFTKASNLQGRDAHNWRDATFYISYILVQIPSFAFSLVGLSTTGFTAYPTLIIPLADVPSLFTN